MPSIFSKIIDGKIPSYKIYENAHVFAFLDIRPIQLGHTLLVPKVEVDYFADVPEPYYLEIFKAAVPIARAIKKATACERVGTAILGFEVPHFHYHLIPMWDMSDIHFSKAKSRTEQEQKAIQSKILQHLSSAS